MRSLWTAALLGIALGACSSSGAGGTGTSTTAGGLNLPPGYVGNFDAGTCFPAPGYTGNELHVGAFCTQGGGQCEAYGPNFTCAADVNTTDPDDLWCIILCTSHAECGDNACCHPDTMTGSGLSGCVPIGCVNDAGGCPAGE